MHRTNIKIGYMIMFPEYIKNKVFSRNPALKQITEKEKLPLFEHHKLLKDNQIVFEKEIGIEQDPQTKDWYFSPELAKKQGYNWKEIVAHPDEYFHFVVTADNENIFEYNKKE